jgi:hypothetical protein
MMLQLDGRLLQTRADDGRRFGRGDEGLEGLKAIEPRAMVPVAELGLPVGGGEKGLLLVLTGLSAGVVRVPSLPLS